ncbi:MAG: hypothetical protein NC411_02255 [Bacteroides sp.]|nr:hypothetical protein [Bacteroides sp.]
MQSPLSLRRVPLLLPLLIMLLTVIGIIPARADSDENAKTDITPKLHGVLRPRWEMDTKGGESRFQLRDARLTVTGNLAPEIDYFFQTNFCDRGKILFLDGWGRIAFTPRFKLQAGQFRLPFGTDCFRAPLNYIFANRSFIGGTMNNVRGVGAKFSYDFILPASSSLLIEAGAFNPTVMSEQNVWVKDMAFAGKALYTVGEMQFSFGAETLIPDSIRINSLTGSATWHHGGWTVEGEYINKHYTNHTHKAAHGYNFFADYAFPVKAGVFNQASVQARFDGMTAYSNGTRNADGLLITNSPARNRVTVGGTLTYKYKAVHCDLRLDYEKYFYHHDAVVATGAGDKICAEMVIRF